MNNLLPDALLLEPKVPTVVPLNPIPIHRGLHVVLGRNNAGKTKFLEAIRDAICVASVDSVDVSAELSRQFSAIVGRGVRVPRVVLHWARQKTKLSTLSGSERALIVRLSLEPDLPFISAQHREALERCLREREGQLGAVLLSSLGDWPATLVSTNRYFKPDGHLNSRPEEDDLQNMAGFIDVSRGRRNTSASMQAAMSDFEHITEGLKAELQVDDDDHQRRWITVQEPGSGARPIQECGDGLRDLLMLVVKVRLHAEGDLLVDEPGIRLHPHAQRRLLAYLVEQSKRRPVWVASHDGVFIGSEAASSRYAVRRESGQTVLTKLITPTEVRSAISDLGWMPRDAYLADRVLYCEGPSDSAVFRRVLTELVVEQPELDGTNIEELGGDGAAKGGGMDRVVGALKRVAPFADHCLLLDSGIGAEAERRAIEVRMQALGVRVGFLRRGELEDYFLDPKLIAAIVLELKGKQLQEAEVVACLSALPKPLKGSSALEAVWSQFLGGQYSKTKGAPVAARHLAALSPSIWAELKAEVRGLLAATG